MEKKLFEYNGIVKENNEIYRQVAKMFGMSDGVFWILYILREQNRPLSQREVCQFLFEPKQTINSAIKKLEADGYISLSHTTDQRSKYMSLTAQGKALCAKSVDLIIDIEQQTFACLSTREQDLFLQIFRKYTDCLHQKIQGLKEE